MIINQAIEQWHQFIKQGDVAILNEIFANDAVFHSPVLHTPQKGKALTMMYLQAAFHVFKGNSFVYKRQVIQDNQAVLEFETAIDGIIINGVDIIECDDEGKIVEFKVMIRPLQGLQKLQEKMMAMLERSK